MTMHKYNSLSEALKAIRSGQVQEHLVLDEVRPYNTRNIAKLLEQIGFDVVNRDKTIEKLSIHLDLNIGNVPTKVINLPEKIEVKSVREIYFTIAHSIMEEKGYSDISKRYAIGPRFEQQEMSKDNFKNVMPMLLKNFPVLPKVFDEAFGAGMVRLISGTASIKQFKKLLDSLNVSKIKRNDVFKEGMFGKLNLPDGDRVDAPFTNFHWLVRSQDTVDTLIDWGCDPAKIWTPDRIVREVALGINIFSINDLNDLIPESKLEGDKLEIPVRNQRNIVTIQYIDDPDPLPNDEHKKVWTISYGNQTFIFGNEQYVEDYGIVPVTSAVWVVLQYVMASPTEDRISGRIAVSAPSVYRQAFYSYAHGDKKIKTAVKDAVGIWQIHCNNRILSPVLNEEITPEIVGKAAAEYLSHGIPAIADSQVKRLYVKNGAMMRGFGARYNEEHGYWELVNSNDQSKPGKIVNRGGLQTNWQAYVYANGTSSYYHQDMSDEPMTYGADIILEESGFRILGTKGVGIANDGVRCRVMLTNWVLENGSGVVSSNPEFKLQIGVRKKVSFNQIAVACEGMDPVKHAAERLKFLDLKTPVQPGQAIAWFNGAPVCTFQQQEQNIEGYGITGLVVDSQVDPPANIQIDSKDVPFAYDLSGSMTVLTTYLESAAKLREAGIKMTCLQEKLTILTIDGKHVNQPDVVVGTENAKQDGNWLALVKMWADTKIGGIDYDVSIGLTDEQQAEFEQWRMDNTKRLWIWTPPLQQVCFDALVAKYSEDDSFAFNEENLTVGQLCWVAEGDMVLSVEVSTVRENMGYQASIAEQVAALACISRPFAMDLWDNNVEVRDALWSAMDMATDVESPDMWIKGLPDEENCPIWFDQEILEKQGVRAMFNALHEVYPQGLTISTGTVDWSGEVSKVTLKFDALAKFSMGQDRVGNGVIMLMQHLTMNHEHLDQWDNLLGRRIGMVKGGITKWATSNGNLKGMTRTAKVLHGRKVKTTSRATIKPGQVGLNPNDPLVRMYALYQEKLQRAIEKPKKQIRELVNRYNNGELTLDQVVEMAAEFLPKPKGMKAGDHILLSRSPMISVVLLEVVITEVAPIGTFLVSDWDFHRGNEGDGDGDPCAALLVPEQYLDEIREALEYSVFGVSGYYVAWDKDDFSELPIMGFYEGAEKKAMAKMVDGKMVLSPYAGPTFMHMGAAAQLHVQIGTHYTRFVGKAFAMCSALTFKVEYLSAIGYLLENWEEYGLTDEQYEKYSQMVQNMGFYATACAKMWRRVYEGLALSGISPEAQEFASNLGVLGATGALILSQPKGDSYLQNLSKEAGVEFEIYTPEKEPDTEAAYLPDYVGAYTAFYKAGIQLEPEEAMAMYWAIRVSALYFRLENMDPGDENTSSDEALVNFMEDLPEHLVEVVDDAIDYGTLRRAGAGMSKRPGSTTAMVSFVHPEHFDDYLPGMSIMGSIFSEAGRMQAVAEGLRLNSPYADK